MRTFRKGKNFKDYVIEKVLSTKYEFRRVYMATHERYGTVALIVYDTKCYDYDRKYYRDMEVPNEFYYTDLLCGVTPTAYEMGYSSSESLVWMSEEWLTQYNMSRLLESGGKWGYDLALKLAEVCYSFSTVTHGGGHYNLTPEHFFVWDENDKEIKMKVIGLTHVCEPIETEPWFPLDSVDMYYRAEETFYGRFDSQSDVCSVGVMTCQLLTGRYPWTVNSRGKAGDYEAEVKKMLALRRGPKRFTKDTAYADTIERALKNVADRYDGLKEFAGSLMYAKLNDGGGITDKAVAAVEDDFDTDLEAAEEESNAKYKERPVSTCRFGHRKGPGFSAVAGMDGLKTDLRHGFIDLLKNPQLASAYGINPPNGLLLYGPPGCGKSYLAQRLAEEVGVAATFVRPSDLGSTYIHGSQSMIAELFERAAKHAPTLLVFDEIDALVPRRALVGDNASLSGEVNEFLTQLENCAERGIFVIGTTNRIEQIDSAVLRTGRIEEVVYVPLPDADNRRALLCMELAKRPCSRNLDIDRLVDMTANFTMSDLSFVVKKASRMAFASVVEKGDGKVKRLDMKLLEQVVNETHSSVDRKAREQYELQHQQRLGSPALTSRRPIGFELTR